MAGLWRNAESAFNVGIGGNELQPIQPPLPIPIPGGEEFLYGHSTGTETGRYGYFVGASVFGTLPLQF